MKNAYHFLILFAFIYLAGCQKNGEIIIMENGLVIEDVVVGDGTEAQDYNKVVVNYTGTLEDGSILRSIQSSAVATIKKNSQVGWGVQPDQLLIFDQAGNCI